MAVPLTRLIGEFAAGLRFEAIPPEAVAIVRNGVTDYAGVAILGRDTPVVALMKSMSSVSAAGGESRVCFSTDGAPAAEAALINGAAGHAFDYDDIGIGAHPAHPTVAMAPAILAEAEALDRPGSAIVAAYVAGYEVWGELARRDRPHHTKGWHPTGVFGSVAAAAAVANLRGLDASRAAHAVAIAASQAGGLVANFGSMAKPFHAGRAAQAGVVSARLAEAGMTASADAIEHPLGFLNAVSPAGKADLDADPILGKSWWILQHGLGFKLYPMCYATHRALDGMLDLVGEHGFGPGDVAGVEVEISTSQAANLANHDPRTALDAKFSGEFAMAMAIVAGRATMAEVSDAFVRRDDVRALMKKVRLTVIEGAGEDRPSAPPDDRVIVSLEDGGRLERKLDHPRGHPTKPVGADVLWTKFADCVRGAMPEARARQLFDRLQALDGLGSVAELPPVDASAQRKAS